MKTLKKNKSMQDLKVLSLEDGQYTFTSTFFSDRTFFQIQAEKGKQLKWKAAIY